MPFFEMIFSINSVSTPCRKDSVIYKWSYTSFYKKSILDHGGCLKMAATAYAHIFPQSANSLSKLLCLQWDSKKLGEGASFFWYTGCSCTADWRFVTSLCFPGDINVSLDVQLRGIRFEFHTQARFIFQLFHAEANGNCRYCVSYIFSPSLTHANSSPVCKSWGTH